MSLKDKTLYPATVTSYDVLKTLAVVLMIVDHIGFYFFPEALWWRAVGRLSAPIWLFLIGFARSRDVPLRLWIGAGILVVSSFIIGPAILPTNILVNMIIIRLMLDWAVEKYLNNKKNWLEAFVFILFLIIPTNILTDYGIVGLMIAMIGYMTRRRYESAGEPVYSKTFLFRFVVFTGTAYIIWALLNYNFNVLQMLFVTASAAFVFYCLCFFRPVMDIDNGFANVPVVSDLLKLGGRYTLEIYVIHILILKVLASYLGYEGMGVFEWTWI